MKGLHALRINELVYFAVADGGKLEVFNVLNVSCVPIV
jgi:hypothetical protein